MEHHLIFFSHADGIGFFLALHVQESPVEILLRAGRLGFEAIQDIFVEQCPGALRHGAFIHDIGNRVEHTVGGKFTFCQSIERFDLLGESIDRCGQAWALFIEIFILPMQDIAEQASGLVIEIVPGGHHIIVMFDRGAIKVIPLDGSTGRAGRAMG